MQTIVFWKIDHYKNTKGSVTWPGPNLSKTDVKALTEKHIRKRLLDAEIAKLTFDKYFEERIREHERIAGEKVNHVMTGFKIIKIERVKSGDEYKIGRCKKNSRRRSRGNIESSKRVKRGARKGRRGKRGKI